MNRVIKKKLYPTPLNNQYSSGEVPAATAAAYITGLLNKLTAAERSSAMITGMDKVSIVYDGLQTDEELRQEKLEKARTYLLSLGRNGASPEDVATILNFLQ